MGHRSDADMLRAPIQFLRYRSGWQTRRIFCALFLFGRHTNKNSAAVLNCYNYLRLPRIRFRLVRLFFRPVQLIEIHEVFYDSKLGMGMGASMCVINKSADSMCVSRLRAYRRE